MKTVVILITGGSGQLGGSLQKAFLDADFLAPEHKELDITERDDVFAFFREYRPKVVLHCAAYNSVDLAEVNHAKCRLVNVDGTRNLAEAAQQYGAYMIYMSSDYVFDGKKIGAYQTTDKKNPLSVYGATKSEAEDIVLRDSQNTVLRISWLFGRGERNFVKAILRAAQVQDKLCVVGDQIGSPTYADDLALLLREMVEKRPAGILHGTNSGYCSRAELAKAVLELADSKTMVQEVPSSQYPSKAPRPLNSCLSKKSLDAAGLHRLPEWRDALTRYLASNQ